MYPKQFGVFLHRDQLLIEPLPEELHYTLAKGGGR